MKFKLTRIIIFVNDLPKITKFYTDAFGLDVVPGGDDEWKELDAGGCNIALHKTSVKTNKDHDSGVKLVFGSKDVAADKSKLEKKGIKMGKIFTFENIHFCNGKDPDGNVFQISDR